MDKEITKKRLRIVNKSKEYITIDIRNDGGLIKMSWNIFKKLFEISKEDNKYCYTKENSNESYNKFKKLLSNAVLAFGKIKDKENPDEKYLETLGKCFNELIILLGCPKEDINELIVDKYSNVIKQAQNKNKRYNKQNQKPKQNQEKESKPNIPTIPVSTFGDLEVFKQLKKQVGNDKRGS